jgi:sensor domain CHASE-containing protein/nitrogen-specific signal transduction histidine kinase/ActR/RegA family two-component response regulator
LKSRAGRRTLGGRRFPLVSAVIAVLVVILAGIFADSQNRQVHEQRLRGEVLGKLSILRANLEGDISGNIQLVQGLIGVISTEPEIEQERFARLGSSLLAGRSQIRNVAAAPGLVITLMYPMQGNEAAIGLDYQQNPAQREAALRARDAGTMVLAGPVDLVQGGRGFVGRSPVYVDGPSGEREFWGLVSTVIDERALYRSSGLLDPALDIDVTILGRDGLGRRGEFFFGNPAILAQNPVTAEVTLPHGSWFLAAVPKGGWSVMPPNAWIVRALVFVGGAFVIGPILAAGYLIEERQRSVRDREDREAQLDRLSRRLEFALAASKVGVWDYNIATEELVWDDRMKELYDIAGKEGLCDYADWRNRLHPEDLARAEAEFMYAIDVTGHYNSEYRLRLRDGEVRHIRAIGAVYSGGDGTRRIVGVNWDVTADVLRQEELNAKRLEAESATVAKSQFLATMSHEIRTPMNGVLGMLDLLLNAPLASEQRSRAELARTSAQSLLSILNDILDFSKLEADQVVMSEANVAVGSLVAEVAALMSAGAQQKGLTLTHQIAPSVPEYIVTDAGRLRQVLVNLVSNAVKFTERGRIDIRVDYVATGPDGRLEVEVEDTGVGIPRAARGQLFQRFVQADSSPTRRSGGTGLGLAISRQLVERMGGSIEVESKEGESSLFRFSIHTHPGVEPRTTVPPPLKPADEATSPRALNPGLRILLAEDNQTNQLIVQAFVGMAGHSVTIVENGRAAVEAVQSDSFDLVLMDVQMPEMDGPTAACAIRALPGPASRIPIIALTANAMSGDREKYLAIGMTDYVSKPVDMTTLLAAIDRAVRTPAVAEPVRPRSSGTVG